MTKSDDTSIYFLAGSLNGVSSTSRAGADLLEHLLTPHHTVLVIAEDRCNLPSEVDGEPVPAVKWLSRDTVRGRLEHELKLHPPTVVVHNGFPARRATDVQIIRHAGSKLFVVHSAPGFSNTCIGRKQRERWRAAFAQMLHGDGLMFQSPHVCAACHALADLDSVRTFLIPGTAREDQIQAALGHDPLELRRTLGLPEDSFIVGCVGRLEAANGQDLVMEALPTMVNARPNTHILFVGALTAFGFELRERLGRLGLDRQALFVGHQCDVPSYLRACDMLLQPSRNEEVSPCVFEAMALQLPVLAAAVGGNGYTVEHGITGWLFPQDDVGALVNAFRVLATNSELRARMGRAARDRYSREFSRARHRERVQQMLRTYVA